MWYLKRYGAGGDSVTVHFASGNGGNKMYVVPERDVVLATMWSAYNRGYGQRRSEAILKRVLSGLQDAASD